MASPLPGAIKARYPEARISWLCQPECKDLLIDHPDVDEVIVWPRKEWQKLWKAGKYLRLYRTIREFKQNLKQKNFDLALDLQGLLKSGYLTWLSGASERVGLGSTEGSQMFMNKVLPRDRGDTSLIGSEYRYLASQLGFETDHFQMKLGLSKDSQKSAQQLIDKLGLEAYFVICPFTTRPQKHWFEDYWQTTAEQLQTRSGLPVVLLGGPADVDAANRLCNGTEIINLAGQTSLQQAAAIIGRSQGLIGVDTGLTHMGHAMQVPSLALFGSTCPYLKTGLPLSKVIYLDLHCAPCRRNPTCDGRFDCLRQITPEMAVNEFALLQQAAGA